MYTFEISENSVNLPYYKSGIYIRDIDINLHKDLTNLLDSYSDIKFKVKNKETDEITLFQKDKLDILEKNELVLNWVEGTLYTYDITQQKIYDIYMLKLTDNATLIKPAKQYFCTHFEHIFGFEYECSDYNPEKIIYLYKRS